MVSEQIEVDVIAIPELASLAEEVRSDRITRLLTLDGVTVAVLNPAPVARARRKGRGTRSPKLADPQDIWKDYDPEKVKQTLQQTRGAFDGVDVKALIEDVYAQRAQDSSGRPAD